MPDTVLLIVAAGLACAVSAGLIAALLPLLRRLAPAVPNARSSHRTPTPQGAGAAVTAATLSVAAGFSMFGPAQASGPWLWMVMAAALLTAVVGAADDIRPLGVLPRLALQTLAVLLVIASLPADLRIAAALPWWIERGLLVIGALWFVNLTNFMDGIDWMTVAEMVPLTFVLAVFGLLGALPAPATLVAAALCGALLGFAPFNRPVARVFLGDVGSLPIGLLAGWLLLLLAGHGHGAAALLLPLYYLADATLTLLRRLAHAEPIWQAHRAHFYQRATDRGLPVPAIVTRVFSVNLGLAALALATFVWPGGATDALALVCGALLVAGLLHNLMRGRR
jgi:UDP-N-acetylmuramyl pentapeptide phosphotransferase/UDP-N-acetylglucosamine-1-phosphate transferase